MRLLTPQDLPPLGRERVCRQSRSGTALGTLIMIALLAAAPIFLLWNLRPSWWISVPIAIVVLGFTKLLASDAINAFRSTNWVVRIARDGLWLNLRSFGHVGYPPGRTVLFVANGEIAHVGRHTTKRLEDNGKRDAHWKEQFLDISLVEPAPKEVCDELAAERLRRVESRFLGATMRSTTNHIPVTLPTDNVLRIGWLTKRDRIKPSLNATLRELRMYYRLAEPTLNDYSQPKELSDAAVDDLILELCRNGNTFAAVDLLRKRRGHSLTEAKQFVDELTEKV